MIPALRYVLGAAALAALSACASGPLQFASCRLEAPEPRSTQALQNVASDRGLGGSGIWSEDRGLGGSGMRAGIIGVVTGFASLCVNGFEVELDETSVVTVEGHPATPADIHLGQLVVIEAKAEGGKLRAASIDVRLAALGPVSTVSDDGKTLTLLGQTVRLSDVAGARPEKLAPGDWVAVSGLRGADTAIEGSSVVRLPEPGARAMVAGVVREGRSAGLEIGALAIGPLGPDKPAFAAGDAVVVEGRPRDGRLAVERVRPQLEARFTAGVRDLSLQTLVPADRLMGLRISPTELRPMTAGGSPIQMEGRLRGDMFVPDRVTVPVLPRDGANAVRNVIVDRGVILRPFTPPDTVQPTLVRPGDTAPPTLPTDGRPQTPPPAPPSP
jgi:hypothetical protein